LILYFVVKKIYEKKRIIEENEAAINRIKENNEFIERFRKMDPPDISEISCLDYFIDEGIEINFKCNMEGDMIDGFPIENGMVIARNERQVRAIRNSDAYKKGIIQEFLIK
jgi:hypothetical protein